MSDEFRTEDLQALEALRAARDSVAPSDAARERARAAFLEAPGEQDGAPRRAPAPRRRRWMATVAAAAMIAVLAVLWFGSTPSETWRVLGVSGPMQVTLDGTAVELPTGTLLDGGSFVVGDSTEVELGWGKLRLRLRPGTEVTVPAAPGRWFGRRRVLHLTAGEAYGSSGLAGVGFDLRLQTPEAEARLLGTTFAVFRTGDATCFCLYRGGLEVTPRGSESFELPVQRRVYIYDDGRPPSIEELDAGETMKLRMVDDAALAP